MPVLQFPPKASKLSSRARHSGYIQRSSDHCPSFQGNGFFK